jgi:two-component sensor histidine kinase
VQLGLVLNETVTNALKYAFPDDRPGMVHVRFFREGADFVLVEADNGVGLPAEGDMDGRRADSDVLPRSTGLGTRLLQALAAQLRGSFVRGPGPGGVGTVAELRFPVDAPTMTVF